MFSDDENSRNHWFSVLVYIKKSIFTHIVFPCEAAGDSLLKYCIKITNLKHCYTLICKLTVKTKDSIAEEWVQIDIFLKYKNQILDFKKCDLVL